MEQWNSVKNPPETKVSHKPTRPSVKRQKVLRNLPTVMPYAHLPRLPGRLDTHTQHCLQSSAREKGDATERRVQLGMWGLNVSGGGVLAVESNNSILLHRSPSWRRRQVPEF
jgi:hypothetical protein